jgi:hypothetical protein
MRYRLRTLLPGQFGLRAIFILTTMAAVAFAIIRLPIPRIGRLMALAMQWLMFRGLTREYLKQRASPADRFNNAVLECASVIVSQVGPFWFIYFPEVARRWSFIDVVYGLLIVLLASYETWKLVKAFRSISREAELESES